MRRVLAAALSNVEVRALLDARPDTHTGVRNRALLGFFDRGGLRLSIATTAGAPRPHLPTDGRGGDAGAGVVTARRYHRGMPHHVPDSPTGGVSLRAVEPADLPILFRNQLDPEANRLAGTKPRGPEAFRALWEQNLSDPGVVARVIISGGAVVGGISSFKADGVDAVGYWIGREHWGRGIATRALALFLGEMAQRPLHATAARANAGSIRVLERCGFRLTGYSMGEETDRYLPCEVAAFVLE